MQIGEELAKGGIAFQGEGSLQQPWEGKNFSGGTKRKLTRPAAPGRWSLGKVLGGRFESQGSIMGKIKGQNPQTPHPQKKRQYLEIKQKFTGWV